MKNLKLVAYVDQRYADLHEVLGFSRKIIQRNTEHKLEFLNDEFLSP